MASQPVVGDKAPDFSLTGIPDGPVKLKQFRGRQNVVLYFYPRDNTPGCTQEACDFRDQAKVLAKAETVVLGVSPDTTVSHEKFAAKFGLPFQLLSDPEHEVAQQYGVWVEKSQYGRKYMGIQRATFLVDKRGKIAAVWPKVKVAGHVDEVLAKLKELK
jgi:thioredoxin-dependent peroxiredoxin